MFEEFEKRATERGFLYPVGIDEAGRGCLAGPVVAAACYLPIGLELDGVDDSKKLSPKKRRELYEEVKRNPKIQFALGVILPDEIDRINILQATFAAMLGAVEALEIKADYLLIDGNRSPKTKIPYETVVSGDARVKSIALASVIAKHYRDELMNEYHKIYPNYGFDRHKGYGTEVHLKALQKWGVSPIHRTSYAPVRELILKKTRKRCA